VDGSDVPTTVIESSPNSTILRKRNGRTTIIATNHSESGFPEPECPRAVAIAKVLEGHEIVDVALAQKALIAAQQDIATHSVYFLPDSMRMWLSYTKDGVPSPSVNPTEFDLKELFKL
jgi:hypothetical protein